MDRRLLGIGGVVLAVVVLAAAAFAGGDTEVAEAPRSTPTASSTEPTERTEPTEPTEPTESPTPAEPPGPAILLPNLRSLDAYDLQIESTPTGRRLRFAAALANVGDGPLVLQPRGQQDCRPRQLSAVQILSVDRDGDGKYRREQDDRTRRQFAGCMLRHFGHDHWHFDAMAAYSLRRPDAARPLAARRKVSFCLRDNERVPGVDTTVRREHFGDCAADRVQGISPGWVDIYGADLDGQWLGLPPGVNDEVVCLDLAADPRELVEETDESDNATTVAMRIEGTTVRRVARTPCI